MSSQTPSPKKRPVPKNTPPPVPRSQAPSTRRKTAIDFDEPLSIRGQLLVLAVVLTISVLLFAVVYGLLRLTRSDVSAEMTGTEASHQISLIEEKSLPSPEPSRHTELSKTEELSKEESSKEESSKEESSKEESSKEELSKEESSKEESSKEESSKEESSKEESSKGESSAEGSWPDFLKNNHIEATDTFNYHYGELMLVNKTHECLTNGTDLCSLMDNPDRHYTVTDNSVSLNGTIVSHFDNMMDDFYQIYGDTDIMVACGFRSAETQSGLYEREFDSVGEDAAQWVAPPGYSEHQTGYAADLSLNTMQGDGTGNINYENVPPYSWINDNCSRYGFVVRYPEEKEGITGFHYESWHFRYVGYPSACYMTEHGLALEEYVEQLHQHPAEDPLLVHTEQGDYALYYTPASYVYETYLTVPDDYPFTVSGDNDGGFIVTVSLTAPAEETDAEEPV